MARVIKNLIAPLQKILLSKGLCPACTTNLSKGKVYPITKEKEKVVCTCGRIFIHDKDLNVYRRALIDEV